MTIINNNNGEHASNSGYVINQQLSEKLVEQYELRIKEKDEQIALLKSLLDKK
jgi:hypothetical protein